MMSDLVKTKLPSKLAQLATQSSVNLVLSGGGVKGVAHIALIEYLESLDIRINSIAGSSAGALVGALYASGKRPKEILRFFRSTPIFRYTWLTPSKAGIFDSTKYGLVISKSLKETFESLDIPLTIVATNIEANEPKYFNKGNLIQPLLASCAVPAVFSPVKINDVLYSDGGIMDNFPIAPFRSQELPIIGSYVCLPKSKTQKELKSIYSVINHTNSLLVHAANAYKFSEVQATIQFPLGMYGTFESKKINEIYDFSKEYLNALVG